MRAEQLVVSSAFPPVSLPVAVSALSVPPSSDPALSVPPGIAVAVPVVFPPSSPSVSAHSAVQRQVQAEKQRESVPLSSLSACGQAFSRRSFLPSFLLFLPFSEY